MVTVLALKIKTNQLKFVQWQHCWVLIDHEFSCGFSINQWFWQSIPTLIQIQERVGNVVQPRKLFPQCDPSPSHHPQITRHIIPVSADWSEYAVLGCATPVVGVGGHGYTGDWTTINFHFYWASNMDISMPVLHGSKVFFSYLVFSCKIFMLSGQEILLLKHVLLVQKI